LPKEKAQERGLELIGCSVLENVGSDSAFDFRERHSQLQIEISKQSDDLIDSLAVLGAKPEGFAQRLRGDEHQELDEGQVPEKASFQDFHDIERDHGKFGFEQFVGFLHCLDEFLERERILEQGLKHLSGERFGHVGSLCLSQENIL